jgi:predicted NodU family carbamoyl transferase
MPIVNTPTEALISFARTSMDALVIGNFVIEKIQ